MRSPTAAPSLVARRRREALAALVLPHFALLRSEIFLLFEVPLSGPSVRACHLKPGVLLAGYVWDAGLWRPRGPGEMRGRFSSHIYHLLDDGHLVVTRYRGRYRRTPHGDSWWVRGETRMDDEAAEGLDMAEVAQVLQFLFTSRRGPPEAVAAAQALAAL